MPKIVDGKIVPDSEPVIKKDDSLGLKKDDSVQKINPIVDPNKAELPKDEILQERIRQIRNESIVIMVPVSKTKVELIRAVLKSKGLDSQQLVNAMAEIQDILSLE